MTDDAKRFLCLNAVLHGYSPMEAFDSADDMAACLETSAEYTCTLEDKLLSLPEKQLSEYPLTLAYLNFYRNDFYPFVPISGTMMTTAQLAQSDRDSGLKKDLVMDILMALVRDVETDTRYSEPMINDGVLYCTEAEFVKVDQRMYEAYTLLRDGPKGTPKGLRDALCKYTCTEPYAAMSAKVALKLLEDIIKAGVKPTAYQESLLRTPDFLAVYKETGCIMALQNPTGVHVDWLLPTEYGTRSVFVTEKTSNIRSHMGSNMRSLVGARYDKRVGHVGKIIYAGG